MLGCIIMPWFTKKQDDTVSAPEHIRIGVLGEQLACQYLKKKKYKILDTHVTHRMGEIDIVARDGDEYVFVEVKTRTNQRFGTPEQSITPHKLHAMAIVAYEYMMKHAPHASYRFDAVAIMLDGATKKPLDIHHLIAIG